MRGFLGIGILALALFAAAPASAYESCGGTVVGLSSYYNQSTGSGFLAVRTGPGTGYQKIGELYNGNEVTLLDRRGNWYQIDAQGIGIGWAFYKWIRRDC